MLSNPKIAKFWKFKQKFNHSNQTKVDIERIVKLYHKDSLKQNGQKINISENQFINLCRIGKSVLLKQPSLLRLSGPICVATGTQGYYKDLAYVFTRCGNPNTQNYLFLGDYIGKGDRNIECLILLICYKIQHPQNFFMLRGCMDSIAMSRSYNFYQQCIERFSSKAWTEACQFLCSLPFAAIIENQIFCSHGGISPSLRHIEEIEQISRPLQTPEVGIACDLVWAEFSYKQDCLSWSASYQGFSYSFNHKAVDQFLKQFRLSMVCRGHGIVYNGFSLNKQKSISQICSMTDQGGVFSNSAAVMIINARLELYFKQLKQRQHFPIEPQISDDPNSKINNILKQKRQKRRLNQHNIQKITTGHNNTKIEIREFMRKQSFSSDEIQIDQEYMHKSNVLQGINTMKLVRKYSEQQRSQDSGSQQERL